MKWQCNVARKRKRLQDVAEADWTRYFESIKRWCPWSLVAWNQGLISITKWNKPEPLGSNEARVYWADLNPRRLKKLCTKLDNADTECEWLWSHPNFGGRSTPIPVLIQQDRARLRELREKANG